jgi:hypothetical protein
MGFREKICFLLLCFALLCFALEKNSVLYARLVVMELR